MNYDEDLTIDPNALDIEWLKQPRLYMRYAEQLANAKDRAARQSDRLDIVKAEADATHRARLISSGDKITVDMVRAAVQQDPIVKKETDLLLTAEHEVGILAAAVKAFDQRKDALESMVRLHGQMYFAGPKVPRELSSEAGKAIAECAHESARDKTAKRMARS